jgi:hypothetical protein
LRESEDEGLTLQEETSHSYGVVSIDNDVSWFDKRRTKDQGFAFVTEHKTAGHGAYFLNVLFSNGYIVSSLYLLVWLYGTDQWQHSTPMCWESVVEVRAWFHNLCPALSDRVMTISQESVWKAYNNKE